MHVLRHHIYAKSIFFSTNRAAELQRRNRSDSELKQQHEILLSTLFLEQQLHSTATDEHKRHVNEFIPVSTTCYDDPTKDHPGRAACQCM
ncbi:unnamed protein product [Rotaria magnacalcarata]|uniref:Uncharacterized protein n=1 Tax=Rotaria magnacalcarata TaxID=392030 RepID=A0A8S3CX56_9BILA|nr:unnamed protein product [Rotaria magnacalcarata]